MHTNQHFLSLCDMRKTNHHFAKSAKTKHLPEDCRFCEKVIIRFIAKSIGFMRFYGHLNDYSDMTITVLVTIMLKHPKRTYFKAF